MYVSCLFSHTPTIHRIITAVSSVTDRGTNVCLTEDADCIIATCHYLPV